MILKNLLFGHDKQIKMQIVIKLYIRGRVSCEEEKKERQRGGDGSLSLKTQFRKFSNRRSAMKNFHCTFHCRLIEIDDRLSIANSSSDLVGAFKRKEEGESKGIFITSN